MLVGLLESLILNFVVLDELLLLSLEVLILLDLDSLLSFELRLGLLDVLLDLLEGFSLLLVLGLDALLFLLDSGHAFLEGLRSFLLLLLQPLLVSFDGRLHLILVLCEPLFLEAKLLILEGLFPLGADSELGEFIHGTIVLRLDVFKFGLKSSFF